MINKLLWIFGPPALAILCGLALNSALQTDGYSITLRVGHERVVYREPPADSRVIMLASQLKATPALKVVRAK